MLILFDVDATLLTTAGAGRRAMEDAGRAIYGDAFTAEGVEFAGRLDPLIIADLLQTSGVRASAEELDRFRTLYLDTLGRLLGAPGVARALPGVPELLDALEAQSLATLGVLTGNFPEGGEIKLRAAGLDLSRFPVRVWGCDSPHNPPKREHLPPVGVNRYMAHHRVRTPPGSVVIVGDTVHDVACAKAHGFAALGVATGPYSVETLREAGADHVVPDLSGVEEVIDWLRTQR